MCLPPMIIAGIAMAAGAGMKAIGQSQADHAMTLTFNAEHQRQQQFEAQQEGKFADSLASTQNTLLSPQAQQAATDTRNSAFTAATTPAAGAYLPGSSSAPTVVSAGNASAGAKADARTSTLGHALASLGGMNDLFQQNNIALGHNSQDIATLEGERVGSRGALQPEMDAAKLKGSTLKMLGGLAQSIGQMAAMGGGNAMVGMGGDPTGMAGMGSGAFDPGTQVTI